MEYVYFILVIVFLLFILFVLDRIDKRTKSKWRKNAYSLLETDRPDPGEITKTIKNLRLYGGRIRKDKEFVQLIARLQDRLEKTDS
jgi:hypothetical protein